MATKYSTHFTREEMIATQFRSLGNIPNADEEDELFKLCNEQLEQARALVGALHVNSGYRSPLVNAAVYAPSPPNLDSPHLKGQAADVIPMFMDCKRAYGIIRDSPINYDQLIYETKKDGSYSWIHISKPRTNFVAGKKVELPPRRQCLMCGPYTRMQYIAYDAAMIPEVFA